MKKAFTLIELLIVISILAIIFAIGFSACSRANHIDKPATIRVINGPEQETYTNVTIDTQSWGYDRYKDVGFTTQEGKHIIINRTNVIIEN